MTGVVVIVVNRDGVYGFRIMAGGFRSSSWLEFPAGVSVILLLVEAMLMGWVVTFGVN